MKAELKLSKDTGPAPFAQGETIVEFDNVSKAYNNRAVLAGVSLKIRKGEVLCVLGPSGTGKSVTLRHINGLEQPDKGDIRVFGESVVGLSEEELSPVRRRVAMLFQGGALFDSMNVEQNVAFPLVEHTDKSAKEIADLVAEKLSMVGLPGIQRKMPSELSGGMRKRVALARSIVTRAHGEEAARAAEEHFTRVVREGLAPEEVGDAVLPAGDPVHLPSVLAAAFGLSTSDARRLIAQGGVRLDGEAVSDLDVPRATLQDALLQAGKRRFVRLRG